MKDLTCTLNSKFIKQLKCIIMLFIYSEQDENYINGLSGLSVGNVQSVNVRLSDFHDCSCI